MPKVTRKSRKGVATAVGTAFFIIIVIISIASIWAISSYQARYQNTIDKMTEWDVQRLSENLDVANATEASTGFNLFVDNCGGVTASIARIYVLNQTDQNMTVYDPQNGTGDGFVNGILNTGEVKHNITVQGTPLNPDHACRIILATDRGRQFSYNYPPPQDEEPNVQPVAFSYGSMEINWVDHDDEAYWVPAYIACGSLDSHTRIDQDLYFRAKFRNLLDHPLTIRYGSVLFQICVGPSNKKVLSFGGYIHEGETTWQPGDEVLIIYKLDTTTWQNHGELDAIFTPSFTQTTFQGSATFSTGTPQGGEEFFSCAILMDGLLVYKNH